MWGLKPEELVEKEFVIPRSDRDEESAVSLGLRTTADPSLGLIA
jgi:hypothetical protein